MSDARNSSNSLRGGGAKQTGGSGRTNKHASGTTDKTDPLGHNGLRALHDRSDAKRKLQLQLTSKKLAADLRAALLSDRHITEEEYEETMKSPLPSVEDARAKLRGMKEFTEKWYDREFREEWLRTVTEMWLEELRAEYEAAVQKGGGGERRPPEGGDGEAMSIEELMEMIANLDPGTAPEERQRLKKKLKRKKQRARDRAKAKTAATEDN